MNAEIFLFCFENALPLVDQQYYGIDLLTEEVIEVLGVADGSHEFEEVKKYLSRYGERAFCYELYHQTRIQMDDYLEQHPPQQNQPVLLLQAELKKFQIAHIVNLLPNIAGALDKEYIPDFLLHAPGPYDFQEVVVEVKSTPKLSFSKIKDDLAKIESFMSNYNYRLGVFLAINISPIRIIQMFNEDINNTWINENISNRSHIQILIKENKDSELVKFSLNTIPAN